MISIFNRTEIFAHVLRGFWHPIPPLSACPPSPSFCHSLSVLFFHPMSAVSPNFSICLFKSAAYHRWATHRLNQLHNSSGWPRLQASPSDPSVEVCLVCPCTSVWNLTLCESVRINQLMIHYMWLTVSCASVSQRYVWVRNCCRKPRVGRTKASPKD